MRFKVRPELPLAALFAIVLLAAARGVPAAEAPAPAQIYQQRSADGRIVLTDRPSPTAVTERTWQMDREDPAATQQRAREVRREAEAVSERIQRRLDAEQRSAAESDLERMRQAQREREFQLQLARAESEYDRASVIVAPFALRPFAQRRAPAVEHRHAPRRTSHAPSRASFLRGPASLENR